MVNVFGDREVESIGAQGPPCQTGPQTDKNKTGFLSHHDLDELRYGADLWSNLLNAVTLSRYRVHICPKRYYIDSFSTLTTRRNGCCSRERFFNGVYR